MKNESEQVSAPAKSATSRLVQYRVDHGGNERDSRSLLDDLVRQFAAKNLGYALAHQGFCRSGRADRLAEELLAERADGASSARG